MSRLFERQRAKATLPSGEVDVDALGELVIKAYEQSERDLRRTDRSIALMAQELDELNRGLENLVQLRTAALREREDQLKEQNFLFDAALNNMSHGLLMFDDDANLVICNSRYFELYGLSAETVKRGTSMQELLEARLASGTFVGDPAEFANWLSSKIKRGETVSRMVDMPDGRTVSIISRPMVGGGWVVTHEDISERRAAERRIAHMAHHDALTDLPNRVLLRERLADAIAALRTSKRLAVFYLDLDNFKAVNDTLGHQFGDELLKTVADRLRACVDENVTVARVGGDEFAIILTDLTQLADAAMVAQAICEAIRAPCELSGHMVPIDTSIGIAIAPDDGADPDELL